MLPPHELKNKEFTKVMRGYNSVEVDEHIEFIIEKYTELYRMNDEYERKLQATEARIDQFRADEDSIRSALINAQKAHAKIISEANERADVILRSAKTNCDKIVAEFKENVRAERITLLKLRETIKNFKVHLFEEYQAHIEFIENIAPELDDEIDELLTDDIYTKEVVERIKKDISAGIVQEYNDPIKPQRPVAEPIVQPEPVQEEVIEEEPENFDMDDIVNTFPKQEPAQVQAQVVQPVEPIKPIQTVVQPIQQIEVEEPEPDIEKPDLDLQRSKVTSIKDRIKELNKKFDNNDEFDDDLFNDDGTIIEENAKTKKKSKKLQNENTDT